MWGLIYIAYVRQVDISDTDLIADRPRNWTCLREVDRRGLTELDSSVRTLVEM